MISLQNPQVPTALNIIEIDKAVYELGLLLDTNLDWLTNAYGRIRKIRKKLTKMSLKLKLKKCGISMIKTKVENSTKKRS